MDAQVDTGSSDLGTMTSVTHPAARSCFEAVSVDSILHTDNLTSNVSSGAGSMVIASGSAILLSHSVERFCYAFNERRFKNAHVDKLTSAMMSLTGEEHENFYLGVRVLQ